jgi:eukaryotic-like serine/threonine-protein kinase
VTALEPQRPSTLLGRYRLLMELGHGAMAQVYVALPSGPRGFGSLVALKVMRDELREHPASLHAVLGAARLAARMSHPNVVVTSEVGEAQGRYYICTEYLEGHTLSQVLKKTAERALPLEARLELLCQMLEGLAYLHGFKAPDGTPLGLMHRDLNPKNLFLTFDGRVKMLNFGVAKVAGISHLTDAGSFEGKLGYVAPEQLFGRGDQRADVFAAGMLMWEVLTYRRLTQDRTQIEIVQRRLVGAESELMRSLTSDVPAALTAICAKAAARAPEARYPSALAMRDAIRRYSAEAGLGSSPQKLSELLHGLYADERLALRSQVEQRMEQALLQAEHPPRRSEVAQPPRAPNSETSTARAVLAVDVPPAGRGRMFTLALVLALGAGVAGGFITRLTPSLALSPNPPVSREVVVGNEPAPAAPRGDRVRLRISATPADAELLWNGATLGNGPFDALLAKGDTLHRLEVRAPGRRSEARAVLLDRDIELHVELKPLTATAGREAPHHPASHGSGAVGSNNRPPPVDLTAVDNGRISHEPREPRERPIDAANPYEP